MFLIEVYDDFLNHMIAVLIVHRAIDIAVELLGYLGALGREAVFQCLVTISAKIKTMFKWTHLLYHPAGIHLVGQSLDLALHQTREMGLLRLGSVLKELLNHIVAEQILHQGQSIVAYLVENTLLLVTVCSFEFPLDEARAMLVTAELHDVAVDVLELVFLPFLQPLFELGQFVAL